MIAPVSKRISAFLADKKFAEILQGSAFTIVARIGGTGLALVSTILVARFYGAGAVGLLSIIQSFMLLAAILAVLGTNVSMLRLIPEHIAKYSPISAFKVYRKSEYLVVAASLLLSVLFFLGGDLIAEQVFSKPHLSFYIRLSSLFIIARAFMDLTSFSTRGLRQIRTFAFLQLLPQACLLIFLVTLTLFWRHQDAPVYAQLVAWGATALLGTFFVRRGFGKLGSERKAVKKITTRGLLGISTPMMMTVSMNFIIAQVGVLILGMYRPETEVGYYAVAVKLALLTSFILQAVNSMAAPKFSELFHTGRLEELFYVARKSTKLIFWTTAPILVVLAVAGEFILSTFGKGFEAAYIPLLILAAGQFVNSISGSTAIFMNMTGRQNTFRNIVTVASIVNLALNFTLTPRLGAVGCAIAGAGSLILWNLWTLFVIKKEHGLTIGYFPFLLAKKPI